MPPPADSCKSCAHFKPGAPGTLPGEGLCLSHAPSPEVALEKQPAKPVERYVTFWPVVLATEWCGEWKKVVPSA